MHLKQPGFTYSLLGPFMKEKKIIIIIIIIKNKEARYSGYIYQNELDKACFQHDMACGDFKDLKSRKLLLIMYYVKKHLILLKIQNMMDINADLLHWFINFLMKKLLVVVFRIFLIKNYQKNYTNELLETE